MNLQELWQQQSTNVSRVSYPTRQATVADRVRKYMGPLERNYSRRQLMVGIIVPLVFGGLYLLSMAVSDRLAWLNGLGMAGVMLLACGRNLRHYLQVRRWADPASLPVIDYLKQSLRRIDILRRDVKLQRWLIPFSMALVLLMILDNPTDPTPFEWREILGVSAFGIVGILLVVVLHVHHYRPELQRYARIEEKVKIILAEWDANPE